MIALKEASETRYWINLMIDNELASKTKFTLMQEELDIIIKILISTTKKLKE
jgi:four helix bundle protein